MLKHIVMWRLKEENKEANKIEMKNQLMALKDKIEALKAISVEFNHIDATQANFDVMLYTEFLNFNDLAIYANHPEHLKVVDFIKSVVTERVAIDY
ncbi:MULTISPECIES: Dabb family protein [Myroides]|uniref:Dabb family protein n=1 Tax=Myroides TaxID=76831 RepID=UPI0013035D50|nr:Dabb family protein [Myroides phaeus]